jgi:hypothetical protein
MRVSKKLINDLLKTNNLFSQVSLQVLRYQKSTLEPSPYINTCVICNKLLLDKNSILKLECMYISDNLNSIVIFKSCGNINDCHTRVLANQFKESLKT